MEIKQINYIGVTFIFYKIELNKRITGVLKSVVLKCMFNDFKEIARSKGEELANKFNLIYLGINDVFAVENEFKENIILGRTSDYDNSEALTIKPIKLNGYFFDKNSNYYRFVVSYGCKDLLLKNFTIEILIVLYLNSYNFNKKIENLKAESFYSRIKKMSSDDISDISFIGIKEIVKLSSEDFKNSIFENLYCDFADLRDLEEDLLSYQEMQPKLEDIFFFK